MKLLAVFALALAAASASFFAPIVPLRDVEEESMLPEGLITNGNNAVEGQFPYQVLLHLFTQPFQFKVCGGSLIGQNWVLTAAHCTENASFAEVYLGATDRFTPKLINIIASNQFFQHESYKSFSNDISLIKIPAVRYSSAISSIALPKIAAFYSTYAGQNAIASGWGRTSDEDSSFISDLQYATMPIIENSVCAKYFAGSITSSIICTDTPDMTSTCKGDSGGPLVVDDVIVGISAFVHTNSCTTGAPAAFTRVTSYLDWIKDKTGIAA